MNILIGCEESQAVCKAFRAKGHNAFSCDTQDCSGGHPEWHIVSDVLVVIGGGTFVTQAGNIAIISKWDMMIGFPPCTHIANAGGVHFEKKREDGRQREAILFFQKLLAAPIEKIALENPVGILSSDWYIPTYFPDLMPILKTVGIPRKPDQVIQPFYFGDPIRKYTCLWTKGLPKLYWTKPNDLFNESVYVTANEPTKTMIRTGGYRTGTIRKLYWQDLLPKKDRAKIKSKTFPGIASAMANQWG
jgi:site-specific DNA-cytosine methylase